MARKKQPGLQAKQSNKTKFDHSETEAIDRVLALKFSNPDRYFKCYLFNQNHIKAQVDQDGLLTELQKLEPASGSFIDLLPTGVIHELYRTD